MRKKVIFPLFILLVICAGIVAIILFRKHKTDELVKQVAMYSGSESCRPCHEKFYQLWHSSRHGLAMQDVTAGFVRKNIKTFGQKIRVGNNIFEVLSEGDSLVFKETDPGGSTNVYTAVHTMGGKYIYYFLALLERGRLQVLPLAYDCKTDSWYNNPESGVRHFETMGDEPLEWMNYMYTFNTTCYNCHVSQLETNYNEKTGVYNTTWREPGINCETCHGPSHNHIYECVKAGEGNIPEDLKIVMTGDYTPDQHNSACGSCHAKARIIAGFFKPGERFYDYFDLITLENPDFYADGRDLGENYTMTTWEMNRCAESGDLHCVSCHTSSGRYRFAGDNANDACMPCHADKVNNVTSHTFHKADSAGSICISCHMPKTSFARMDRSDHSFRPPMPKATVVFGSPNACNICHYDESAEWAQTWIEKTHKREYQQKTIEDGLLIRKARAGDWSDLDGILNGLKEGRFDKVFTTSFIRLLENCEDTAKRNVMIGMTYNKSPLVRGAAAHSLYADGSSQALERLSQMVNDGYRVVRMNAAFALSSYPECYNEDTVGEDVIKALEEYRRSIIIHPDNWSSYYNLGNFYSNRNEMGKAIDAYRKSLEIYPEAIMPMVNAGFLYSLNGEYKQAEVMFTRALSYQPDNGAALLNLALLYGESGNKQMSAEYFLRLLEVSEKNAVAAYNLAILLSGSDINESVRYSKSAMEWDPDNTKYKYTYAYFLSVAGNKPEATAILKSLIETDPLFIDSYLLLSGILADDGNTSAARTIIENALDSNKFTPDKELLLKNRLEALEL